MSVWKFSKFLQVIEPLNVCIFNFIVFFSKFPLPITAFGSFRILANTLQNYMLCTFRKVLISAPVLLKSFREEGLWDLIFSEKFFYFGSSVECIHQIVGDTQSDHFVDATESNGSKSNLADVNILQSEAISFLEFAATLNENTNNLVFRNSSSLPKMLLILPNLNTVILFLHSCNCSVLFVVRMLSIVKCT